MEFIKNIGSAVGGLIGVDNPLLMGIITLALALVILLAIVIGVIVGVSHKKKAKAIAKQKAEEDRLLQEKIKKELEAKEEARRLAREKTLREAKEQEEKQRIALEQAEKEKQEQEKAKAKKPATKKPTAKKTEPKKEEKPAKKLLGKWIVEIKSDNEYVSCLLASNGEIMLGSETYSTEEGARNGIETIIKGVETGKFVIYQDKNKNYYYKLKSAGNRLLCVGEIYKSEDQCLKAVESVKRIAKDSPVTEGLVEGHKYVEYTPVQLDEETVKKGLKGKWKIETLANGHFSAKLYASNGQLMLATEEVSARKNAEKAIESVTKNASAGNFIIDKDKFGRFYYKLRTAQKSVICIGEAYESLDSCTSAIESVRRFAMNAVIVED